MRLMTLSDGGTLLLVALGRLGAAGLGSPASYARLARRLGDLSYLRRAQRRRTAERLAPAVGGDATAADVARVTREAFRHGWVDNESFWLQAFAHSAAWRRRECRHVRVEGLDTLEAAVARGRGAILWECLLGPRMLGKVALIERGFPLVQVHGPAHGGSRTWTGRHVLRPLHRRAAGRLFAEVIDIEETSVAYLRRVTARLRDNGIVCIPGMGYAGRRFESVDFLGAPFGVATGVVTLARTTGAALIPFFCVRDGAARRVVLDPPLDPALGAGRAAVLAYVRRVETLVRAHPEQWRGGRREPAPGPQN